MSNLPDGVTQADIDSHFGGQEDDGEEIVISGVEYSLLVRLIGDNLFLSSIDTEDGFVNVEFVLDLSEARELADAIARRVL